MTFGPMVPGAGMRLGAKYVTHAGDRTSITARGAYSVKQYKSFAVEVASPGHLSGRLDLALDAAWRDSPQMPFYGLGNEAPESNRTHLLLHEGWGAAGARLRPTPWRAFSLAAEARRTDYEIGRGRGGAPTAESRFTPLEAPGLGLNPTYWRYAGEMAVDTRPTPGYSRRGTLLRGTYSVFDDRESSRLDFDRVDLEVTELIPILRGNWVVALHGQAASTMTEAGSEVPFFLQPYLGSGSTLRGYGSFRFRDRHALLLSGEFRWTPNEALDMAIFYDAGKVAPRRRDLDLTGLHTDVGIGARFHADTFTALRIDVAKGSEGYRLVFELGQGW